MASAVLSVTRVRGFAHRHRTLLTVVGSLATAAVLVLVLAGRREEFAAALGAAPAWVLAVTVLLQVVALLVRSRLLLRAVGVDASFFDAIAVLIAVVTLGQLPVGPSVGAAAAVLILGRDGVAAAAAAGVLLTATGTAGGLCFLAWAGADGLWIRSRARRRALG